MSKKHVYLSYFFLAGILFALMNLPHVTAMRIRHKVSGFIELHAEDAKTPYTDKTLELKAENYLLKRQLEDIRAYLIEEDAIDSRLMRLQQFDLLMGKKSAYKSYYQRRCKEVVNSLEKELWQVSARVIKRDPALWGSAFWIDVGTKTNDFLGHEVIAKNSPVIYGDSIVGIIDEVLQDRAKVRLITDRSLHPSVRVARGGVQEDSLLGCLEMAKERLLMKESTPEIASLVAAIEMYQGEDLEEGVHLAKGILQGSSYTLWRQRSQVLKGIGFNFEFDDDEGERMELHAKHEVPLLQVGDLLVTTGMDGVFPAGLSVAYVTKIFPLKEGGHSYEIEAKSTIPNLDTLAHLSILPPL